MIDRDLVPIVADLLMGAAYADSRLRGHEALTIRKQLAELLEVDKVPGHIENRLMHFDPDKFDLDLTVATLPKLEPDAARKLLEMVAAVNASDGELDFDEDEYLHQLASAIGVSRQSYADLTIDVEDDEEEEPAKPPPVPTK